MHFFSLRPVSAMLWELWRVSRFELLVRLGFVVSISMLILAVSEKFHEAHWLVLRGIMLMLTSIACIFSSTWMSDLDNQKNGFTFRLGFARPISNLQLVLVPMAYSAVTAVIGYFVCAMFTRLAIGLWLPMFGPAFLVGCIVCILICATWSSTYTLEKILSIFTAALAIAAALGLRHHQVGTSEPILLAIGRDEYFQFSLYEYLCLIIVSCLTLWLTVYAVGQQRCGDGFSWTFLPNRLLHTLSRHNRWIAWQAWVQSAVGPQHFRSPSAAQLWFEARRSIHLLFFILAFSLLVLAFVVLTPLVNPSWGGPHSPRIWLGAIVLCPLVYQLLATDPISGLQNKQGATTISLFEATRPRRCDQMIAIKLIVIAGWSTLGIAIMALMAATHATLAGQWADWLAMRQTIIAAIQKFVSGQWTAISDDSLGQMELGSISMAWWLVAVFDSVFYFFFSSAMLMSFLLWLGRAKKRGVVFTILLTLHLCLFAWDLEHGRQLRTLWLVYGYLIPVAVIVFSLAVLRLSISAGYLGRRYFLAVFSTWSIVAAMTVASLLHSQSFLSQTTMHPLVWLLAAACAITPLASAACAPHALAAFRHG